MIKSQALNQLFYSKIINIFLKKLFYNGQKSKSYTTFLKSLAIIQHLSINKTENPIHVVLKAIENAKPFIEVQSIRIAGTTYRVPVEINETRQHSLAIKWLITNARNRNEKTMAVKLAKELYDTANNGNTNTLKKKEEIHKMAESSRPYINYRW
jgi:small subunit ribosomal protein S7